MTSKIKAADAKFGEWYEHCGERYRFVGNIDNSQKWRVFLESNGGTVNLDGEELTHVPDCTGWGWEPSKPEPDISLEASIKPEQTDALGWITDRRPTKEDCREYTDGVLVWLEGGSVAIAWHDRVIVDQPWMPLPPPYVPPKSEPDISLEASILRVYDWVFLDGACDVVMETNLLFAADMKRVIEAAKERDLEQQARGFTNSVTNPDGVGEGYQAAIIEEEE